MYWHNIKWSPNLPHYFLLLLWHYINFIWCCFWRSEFSLIWRVTFTSYYQLRPFNFLFQPSLTRKIVLTNFRSERQASGNLFLEKMLLQKSYIPPSYNFILDFLARKSSEDSAIDLCILNKLTSEYCLPITLVIPFFLEFILVA